MSQHICTHFLSVGAHFYQVSPLPPRVLQDSLDFLSLCKGNVFIVFASEVHLTLRSGELVVWSQFCVMLVNKYGLGLFVFFFCAQGNLNERMTDLHGSLKLKTLIYNS